MQRALSIFCTAPPGLESVLADELRELEVRVGRVVPGGVELGGDWHLLARLNVWLRTAGRVLVRLASFRATKLVELRRKAAAIDWGAYLVPELPLHLRVSCRASRIYHSGAAAERLEQAIADAMSPPPQRIRGAASEQEMPEAQRVLMRIERDEVTLSIDSSGEHLHRRGYRLQSAKAPLRENLAAALLRVAAFARGEALVDPMCGSGTFVIEAAMAAAGLAPGARRRFACEVWPCLPAGLIARERARALEQPPPVGLPLLCGFDRDAGAIAAACANAERAGVADWVRFEQRSLSRARPQAAGGLVICNPPYGARIGDAHALRDLYAALGRVFRAHFAGWRLAVLTSRVELARAAERELRALTPVVDNGGIKVKLYGTDVVGFGSLAG